MTSATMFHFNMFEYCYASTVPKCHVITKASSAPLFVRQSHSHLLPSSSVSFRSKIVPFKLVPFVAEAEAEEWAQDEGQGIGIGYEEDVGDTDSFTWGSNVENVESGDGESFSEPSEDAKLFVGNLPYNIDSEKLAQLFDKAGVVEISEVIYNRQTDQSRGFGFVTMSSVEEAENAAEMFNGFEIEGRQLTVNKAAPKGSQPERVERVPRTYEPAFRMYVGNLPWQVDNTRLEQVFSEHGKVVDARVVYDRETGRSRGFGFVTMSCEEELNDAIAALDGQNLDGRAIRVNVAEEKPRRGGF